MNIAFFDFDGTMTREDSLFVFLKFIVGRSRFFVGMSRNIHYLIGYLFGFIDNAEAKQKIASYFFEGMSESEMSQKCQNFIVILEGIIKQSAMERMKWHLNNADQVVIVSATFSCYLAPLARKLGVDCIATELEVRNGVITGRFATPNCYGEEKVRRIQEKYRLETYEEIFAYGDSKGDREMLKIAKHRFYRLFE